MQNSIKSPEQRECHNLTKLPDQSKSDVEQHQEEAPVFRHRVFIYGTLKRGQPNEQRLWEPDHGHARYIGEAHTKEKWPLILGTKYNIPLLIYSAGTGKILHGELFEIDDRMLAFMDHFEGHPIVYERDYITIVKEKNTVADENVKNSKITETDCNTSVNAGPILSKEQTDELSSKTVENSNVVQTDLNGDLSKNLAENLKLTETACQNGNNTGATHLPEKELETITCYAYFLKDFKEEYLDRPLLSNYDDNHNHLKYTPGPTLKCADDILQVMKAV